MFGFRVTDTGRVVLRRSAIRCATGARCLVWTPLALYYADRPGTLYTRRGLFAL